MRPFIQIAIPHKDIIEGRLTMDVFAADLWQVAKGKAPMDYQDADMFFKKTYLTKGLKNIIEIAKARLEGKSGNSVIQLQTPFGGGKTHTLIALYHKAKEWNAKVVVLDGTALNPRDNKLWEELERQLTGKIEITKGDTAPGKESLINLISENQPVLILIDELLEYTTKAAGIKVGDSSLADQTKAFMHELTGAVSSAGNALLFLTLPSSILEHYDESAERMFQQLQKIVGRREKIYTPVREEEIEDVVRARLFNTINEKKVKRVVNEFVEYAKNEGLLVEDEILTYRNRFIKCFPFKPEVIDILYKRWGSFPTFQRTRGVLRLLSLVVHSLMDKNIPFIRLGDFNLDNDELRRELIKHIGQEWDSIIAQDITGDNSGAIKVDKIIGDSYRAYKLGTVVSTTIFMMSFSGRGERGSSIREIKLASVYPSFPSAEIDNVVNHLREKLFYLSDEGLFFTNQSNLNKIIISKEENIPENEIYVEEKEIIRRHLSQKPIFKIYIHPQFSRDIPDNPEIKLIILNATEPDDEFLEKHGETPRVYRNTLIFLGIDEERSRMFHGYIRKLLALRAIDNEEKLNLSVVQRRELKNKLKVQEQRSYEELRKYYRFLYIPGRGGKYRRVDLGIPTFGESEIDKEIHGYLRSQGEILERISPKIILDRYLADREYIEISALYDSMLRTPGELRIVSKESLLESIKEGIRSGLFKSGYLEGDEIKCTEGMDFNEYAIIVKPELCKGKDSGKELPPVIISGPPGGQGGETPPEPKGKEVRRNKYTRIDLKLDVPVGQISTIARIVSYLKSKFGQCAVRVDINAVDGEIDISDYEDRILEALRQAGVDIIEEEKEEE